MQLIIQTLLPLILLVILGWVLKKTKWRGSGERNHMITFTWPLLYYYKTNNHRYFVDQSNFEPCYERNIFRERFSNELLEKHGEGIKRSFNYLKEDKEALKSGITELFHHKELFVIGYKHPYQIPRVVDQYLKKLGYLLSASQREELKNEISIIFGGKWAVEVK